MMYQLNLKVLKKLEQTIIGQWIVFAKNSSDAQGTTKKKIEEAICDVPVD